MTTVAMFMIGLALGLWVAEFLWRAKIREKADLGMRLRVWGQAVLRLHGPEIP